MIFYFAYGANCNTNSMDIRCPHSTILGPATLPNYKLAFRYHADLELEYNSSVSGLLWSITTDDLLALDKFESVPHYYIRHLIWVFPDSFKNIPVDQLNGNDGVEAWVYEMVNKDFSGYPSEKYWDLCWDGYEANNVNTLQLEHAYNSVVDVVIYPTK